MGEGITSGRQSNLENDFPQNLDDYFRQLHDMLRALVSLKLKQKSEGKPWREIKAKHGLHQGIVMG